MVKVTPKVQNICLAEDCVEYGESQNMSSYHMLLPAL